MIEHVSPEIDGGRFAIKRTVGERIAVEADIFADGHEVLSAAIRYRHASETVWSETPMEANGNDLWRGSFTVNQLGTYYYTVAGWINRFRTWRRDFEKQYAARAEVTVELEQGRRLIQETLRHAERPEAGLAISEQNAFSAESTVRARKDIDADKNVRAPEAIRAPGESEAGRAELSATMDILDPAHPMPLAAKVSSALSRRLAELMDAYSERLHVAHYAPELRVTVDPELARCSAWYELFPRSCAPEPGRHGTFRDCAAWLPRIAHMGFDIVYLPPVHPIGRSFRKGKDGGLQVRPEDPGSPWAIGSEAGGHKAVHPELGTLEDFRNLVGQARALGLDVALDIAFQCSPNHPYVREHPQWFRHRPDGTIQYAENPPKKYQDIYPLDFETEDWRALWVELKSIFEFWIDQGVRVFRVDNPHTKPFRFWEWCLGELKGRWPELIFLSEAFTRPRVMYYLAKLGFTQSYNYFPWRNHKRELEKYFTELTQTEVREYFRPNLWPNTPDILTEYLQYGGAPAFMTRLILAGTLGASYGIYGPPFEAREHRAREIGSEEYRDSEKYEVRHWDLPRSGPFQELITRLNRARRENPALRQNGTLRFHEIDNEQLLAYSKRSVDGENLILTVVNLDPHYRQSGFLTLAPELWGLPPTGTYQVHELLTDERYLWSGARNYVELDPQYVPAHVFRLRRYVRTERDFDYFV